MRILHLGKYYPPAPGGIESHVQAIARGQSAEGCRVTVLCVNHADRAGKDITHSRLKSTSSLSEWDGDVRVERAGRWFGLSRLEVCPSLPWKMRAETSSADIVHLHTPNPLMLWAWWLAGNRAAPLVVTHHSDVVKQRVLRYAVAPFEKSVYRRAKKILSDSPQYGDCSPILQKHAAKTEILPLGIDLSPFTDPDARVREISRQVRGELGDPLWLMVGRMTYYKGYPVAIQALRDVRGKLVIVGNGPLDGKLKSLAAEAGVVDRIVWKSHLSQEELIAHYHAATALWFPSIARSEGFGLAQVEAMASGCPVINTAIPGSGVPWVSQHDVSGLTIPMEDPGALANAANQLIGDHEMRSRLSRGAAARAKAEFGFEKMARTSIEIYKKCLN